MSQRLALPLVSLVLGSLLAGSALAAPLGLLSASYAVASPPASLAVNARTIVPVQLTNTGDETWTAGGANPVNVAYHWYSGGTPVVWDGVRTTLGADVAPGGARTVNATVAAPTTPGTYVLRFALVKEGVSWFPPGDPYTVSVAAATYVATYQVPAPPTAMGAGANVSIGVTLTNVGNQTWNTSGPNPVNLAYHWYDSGGTPVVWDGVRTALPGDVAPSATTTVTAVVAAPTTPGSYVLRFALVKEGVTWFAPGDPLAVTAQAPYRAQFTPPTLPSFVVSGTYTVPVVVTNVGGATWPSAGANPVRLAYHWLDTAGKPVVWDGVRTALAGDVPSGASATLNAQIIAPPAAGTYALVLDMVREGVAWFAELGSPVFRATVGVGPGTYGASYDFAAVSAYWGEQKTIQVAVTNTGNVTWNATGTNPVNLSYHIYDGTGRVVVWDGARTSLGSDLAPSASRTLALSFTAPKGVGSYTLAVEMVREGISWFSALGIPPATRALTVTSGLSAGYGATSTPALVTIGAVVDLSVQVDNYGPRTWPAGGANPVRLSYHIYGASSGATYVWDGARGYLANDLPAGSSAIVKVRVTVPSSPGDYVIAWDLVQEGVTWFSQAGVAPKRESFGVTTSVVFYGSGFGHGVGMSQFGAQGYALGAAGPALTGEQIILKYFPGTQLQPTDPARPYNRVLLSQPSSQQSYVCGTNRYFNGTFGDVASNAGFRVLDETAGNAEIGRAGPNVVWQFVARTNGILDALDKSSGTDVLVRRIQTTGDQGFAVIPLDASLPVRFLQKDQTDGRPGFYRGNFRFTSLGGTLRVINAVSYDDYVRGVIAFEMPKTFHPEALKAQAYAARSYAWASFRGGSRDYDVTDDQADQCYGGVAGESPETDAAAAATAGKLITYQGSIVKAYFSSSSGGHTVEFGCWGSRVVWTGNTWVCTPDASQPYLPAAPDPADRFSGNPRASWTVTKTPAEIVSAAMCAGAVNIGTLLGVDVSNQSPPGVGHVLSVRLIGSAATVNVKAETFLRTCLGLRSTMVRLAPF